MGTLLLPAFNRSLAKLEGQSWKGQQLQLAEWFLTENKNVTLAISALFHSHTQTHTFSS